jgi:1-deoxy-D-xylulose-5-phosphate reductoisomerase
MGGTAPAVLNAADEVAVEAFLDRRIPFSDIPTIIAATLEAHHVQPADGVEAILGADAWARKQVRERIS